MRYDSEREQVHDGMIDGVLVSYIRNFGRLVLTDHVHIECWND